MGPLLMGGLLCYRIVIVSEETEFKIIELLFKGRLIVMCRVKSVKRGRWCRKFLTAGIKFGSYTVCRD
jgi:hypothetical protein